MKLYRIVAAAALVLATMEACGGNPRIPHSALSTSAGTAAGRERTVSSGPADAGMVDRSRRRTTRHHGRAPTSVGAGSVTGGAEAAWMGRVRMTSKPPSGSPPAVSVPP